ncbi:MAG TPA: 50S ribosomal protein L9 [Bacteroidales bacterium]|nr:50S ribosomal protein L9 [Bacteroidales bacterium]
MEVILKKDMPNLGYENEIVHVKDGYGRNYLIPKGFAIPATESNRKMVAETQKQKSFKENKTRMDADTLAKALENLTVKIGAKAAPTGKIYGSVNAIQIAEAIKEQFNYEIDRKKITIDGESIKELGTYEAMISLYKDIKVKLNFEVIAE